jgi:hypothetical protein
MAFDPLSLLRRIELSFGASIYPGDGNIVRAEGQLDVESARIREALKGRHWRDVSFELLQQLARSLPFLSAEGYRFYLPAFMMISIVDFARAGVIADEILLSLTPPQASDVDRIRELAALHPELQPFGEREWAELLATLDASHHPEGLLEAIFLERAVGFGVAQADVIREFLEYLRDVHGDAFPEREPERALERYWASAGSRSQVVPPSGG